MIPKIIHYCWFGEKPLPDLVKKCIDSWKKYCPDYEIVRWDESNYDVNKTIYTKEAYSVNKWAFVSDYARLDIVYNYGGIYLDTDVELINSLDSLLDEKCFLAAESTGFINTGLGFGAEKNSPIIGELLATYDNKRFIISKGIYDQTPCPRRNSEPLYKYGYVYSKDVIWRIQSDVIVLPPDYFSPLDYETKQLNITENTLGIHLYSGSWLTDNQKELHILTNEIKNSNKKFKFFRIHILKYKYAKKDKEVNNVFQYVWLKIRKKIKR